MDTLDFSRSHSLNNIPQRKLQEWLSVIDNTDDDLQTKSVKKIAVNRYAESNIPIEYWSLKMEKDFVGDQKLLTKYNEYVADIKNSYITGSSFCLASEHGRGKTMTITSILKRASAKGYSCLYNTLENVVGVLTQAPNDEKFAAKRELAMVDFLVIDEVDIRFFNQSENSSELFGKTFETILRNRLQNKLPILLATNSPNIKEAFQSFFKDSLGSLMAKLPIIYVFGDDFRKKI